MSTQNKLIKDKKLKIKKYKISGFTLVELIVVISILAILGAIAFLSFSGHSSSARDSTRISDMTNTKKGLDLYMVKSGAYPLPDSIVGTGNINGTDLTLVGDIGDSVVRNIGLSKIIVDPLTNLKYTYGTDTDRKYYQIATILEKTQAYNNNLLSIDNVLAGSNTYNYPAGNTYKAKVSGNYNGLLKKKDKLYNLPSLIFTSTTNDLTSTSTYFVVNGESNLPNSSSGTISTSEVLKKLTGTGVSLTGVIAPTTTAEFNTNSGILSQALGYNTTLIGKTTFGSSYGVKDVVVNEDVPVVPTIKTYDIGFSNSADWVQESSTNGTSVSGGKIELINSILTPTTWDPNNKHSTFALSSDNLTATTTDTSNHKNIKSKFCPSSGKWYWEIYYTSNWQWIGFGPPTDGTDVYPGGANSSAWYSSYDILDIKAVRVYTGLPVQAINSYLGVAIDIDSGKARFRKSDGSWLHGNPTTGISPSVTGITGQTCAIANGYSFIANFGQTSFHYTVPTGFNSGLKQTGYPTTQPYYITTSSTNSLSLSNVSKIKSATITNIQPTGTSIKALVSFDGRNTWKKWDGTAWVDGGGLANLQSGNTIEQIQTGLTNLSKTTQTNLDFAFDLSTTDSTKAPEISGISLSYE